MFKNKTKFIFILGLIFSLNACGYNVEFFPDNSPETRRSVLVPKPDLDNPQTTSEATDIQAEVEADKAFVELTEDENLPVTESRSALKIPPKPAPTPEQRLADLEDAVLEMKNQLSAMAPAILKLSSLDLEGARKDPVSGRPVKLSPDISSNEQSKYIAAPIQTTSTAQKQQYKPQPKVVTPKAAPQKVQTGRKVNDVRFGEYPNKTRIVIDLNQPATYQKDLDNNERVLVIELNDTAWVAAPQKTWGRGSAVKSYSTQATSNGGSRVIFELANPSNITYEKSLPPNDAANRSFRIVFDVTK